MKPSKKKFFAELKKSKANKTDLKSHKVQLGAIDDIYDKLDNIDWDNNLNEVYSKFDKATAFAGTVVNTTQTQIDEINRNLFFLEDALDELGIDGAEFVADGFAYHDRISDQLAGLKDDLKSGVLSGI
tara:strand:- start:4527 stop:4910 length:384 start_codon:yes stop_codon:yes gene_type:complete